MRVPEFERQVIGMAMKSHHKIERCRSRQVKVGCVVIGGDVPERYEPSVATRAQHVFAPREREPRWHC